MAADSKYERRTEDFNSEGKRVLPHWTTSTRIPAHRISYSYS